MTGAVETQAEAVAAAVGRTLVTTGRAVTTGLLAAVTVLRAAASATAATASEVDEQDNEHHHTYGANFNGDSISAFVTL